MSGGSFDYAYNRTDSFADDLENRLDAGASDEELGPDVQRRLRLMVEQVRWIAALMREAEWLYSGDTGPETFTERVAAIDAKHGFS